MHIHPANVGYLGSQPFRSAEPPGFPRHHLPEAEGTDVKFADFTRIGVDDRALAIVRSDGRSKVGETLAKIKRLPVSALIHQEAVLVHLP